VCFQKLKASPLLRPTAARRGGVGLALRHWVGWDERGGLRLDGPQGDVTVDADATVLALGGASWPRLGSDGGWVAPLARAGIVIAPLRPANCGVVVAWSDVFRDRFHGQPLKRIALSFGGETARGEAMITQTGLEGGAVYALSAALRAAIEESGEAVAPAVLRPLAAADLMKGPRRAAPSSRCRLSCKTVRLPPVAIGLLHEATQASPVRLTDMKPAALAALINAVPLR
jgi:predicted flavoprotein YhiN